MVSNLHGDGSLPGAWPFRILQRSLTPRIRELHELQRVMLEARHVACELSNGLFSYGHLFSISPPTTLRVPVVITLDWRARSWLPFAVYVLVAKIVYGFRRWGWGSSYQGWIDHAGQKHTHQTSREY